ncbi:MAG: AtpZ/AtpI family protein [Bacteroidetes bacterium]|nr:AtpZ/AtpI family protein [Bacteroidota bacterium]
MIKKKKKGSQSSNNESINNLISYSSLAIEMMISILIFSWLGNKIDKKLQLSYPIFLSLFSLSSIVANLYLVIRKLTRLNSKNEIK